MARRDVRRGEDLARPPVAAGAALLACALLLPATAGAQKSNVLRGRWHFVQDDPPFEYSVLFTRSDAGDETRLLLAAGGQRLELVSAQDPSGRDSTESVRDAAGGAAWSRRLLLWGYASVPGCGPVRPPDACVLFTGPGGSYATSLSRFHGEGGAATRAGAAATASEALAAKLLTLAPLMGVTVELDAYGGDFLSLVWPDRFHGRKGAPKRARRTDGCAFDASFGYPCPVRTPRPAAR